MSTLDKPSKPSLRTLRGDAHEAVANLPIPGPSPEADHDAAMPLPIGRLIGGLYRRRWIVLLGTLLGAVVGVAAAVLRSDRYWSEGLFLFDHGGEQLSIAADPAMESAVTPGIVGNIPYVLVSRELCERVVDAVGAERILAPFRAEVVPGPDAGPVERLRAWFANFRRGFNRQAVGVSRADAVEQLQNSLNLTMPRGSSVLVVGYAAPDPFAARDTLSVFMDAAISWHLEVYGDAQEIQLLEKSYERTREIHGAAVAALDEFLRELGVTDFDAALERRRSDVDRIVERLSNEAVNAATQKRLCERLENELKEVEPVVQVSEWVLQTDPRIERLEASIDAKTKELRDLESRFLPEDPAIRIVRNSLRDMEAELKVLREQSASEFLQRRTMANPRYGMLEQRMFEAQLALDTHRLAAERLEKELEPARAALEALSGRARKHEELERAVVKARQDLEQAESRMELARAKQSLSQHNVSSLSILQRPGAGRRETMGGLKIMAASTAGGCFAAVALALALAFLDRRIRSARDLESLAGIPLLAAFPNVSRKHVKRHLRLRDLGC